MPFLETLVVLETESVTFCSQHTLCKKVKVLVAQSCLILCDYSSQNSSVHGILQAKILEWVAMLFSRGSAQPRD